MKSRRGCRRATRRDSRRRCASRSDAPSPSTSMPARMARTSASWSAIVWRKMSRVCSGVDGEQSSGLPRRPCDTASMPIAASPPARAARRRVRTKRLSPPKPCCRITSGCGAGVAGSGEDRNRASHRAAPRCPSEPARIEEPAGVAEIRRRQQTVHHRRHVRIGGEEIGELRRRRAGEHADRQIVARDRDRRARAQRAAARARRVASRTASRSSSMSGSGRRSPAPPGRRHAVSARARVNSGSRSSAPSRRAKKCTRSAVDRGEIDRLRQRRCGSARWC